MSLDGRFRERIEPDWSDERARRVLDGVPARAAQRRARRITGVAMLLVLVGVAAVLRGGAAAPSLVAARPERRMMTAPRPADVPRWKALAERGDWLRAWEALRESELRDEAGELLAAAEVARR